jgi:hypothetical protein
VASTVQAQEEKCPHLDPFKSGWKVQLFVSRQCHMPSGVAPWGVTSDWSVDWMEGKQARAMRGKSNAMGKQEKSGRSDKKAVESKFWLGTGASAKEGASLR